MMKCKDCEHGRACALPRNGNGASAHRGHFSQTGYTFQHPEAAHKLPIVFYCGMHKIFNNQGNRPGAFKLWIHGQFTGV